ncbi:hypothetical protein DU846_22575, partial [Salmonella enterica subsp. diarizonae]|nr:hypothetical protein [Salmonella enterica subsp. diarizonae]
MLLWQLLRHNWPLLHFGVLRWHLKTLSLHDFPLLLLKATLRFHSVLWHSDWQERLKHWLQRLFLKSLQHSRLLKCSFQMILPRSDWRALLL